MRAGVYAIAGAAASALLLAAAPANAGTAGPTVSLGSIGTVEYLRADFENVVSQEGATADCDDGDIATGGGGSISGPRSNAALNASFPASESGDGWRAAGSTSGITPRLVRTYAICGEQAVEYSLVAGLLAPAGETTDLLNFGGTCDTGADAVSGGLESSGGDARLLRSNPSTAAFDWQVSTQNFSTSGANATAWFGCSDAYDVSYRTNSVQVAANTSGAVRASCGRSQAVIGGGHASTVAGVAQRDTWATATRPFDSKEDRRKVPEDGWSVAAFNDSAQQVKLTAHAVCAAR